MLMPERDSGQDFQDGSLNVKALEHSLEVEFAAHLDTMNKNMRMKKKSEEEFRSMHTELEKLRQCNKELKDERAYLTNQNEGLVEQMIGSEDSLIKSFLLYSEEFKKTTLQSESKA